MRYLCFADTVAGEMCKIVNAQDDDTAMDRMRKWLWDWRKITPSETYCMMGVWEKDPSFYTATKMTDLDGWEWAMLFECLRKRGSV